MGSCCHDTTWRWGVAILLPRRMVHRVKLDPHQERADAPRQPAARARWSPRKRDVALTGNIERRPSTGNRWRVLLCSSTENTSVLAARLSGEIYSFPLLQHFLPWHYFPRRASGNPDLSLMSIGITSIGIEFWGAYWLTETHGLPVLPQVPNYLKSALRNGVWKRPLSSRPRAVGVICGLGAEPHQQSPADKRGDRHAHHNNGDGGDFP